MVSAWPVPDEVALRHLEADWSGAFDEIRYEAGMYRAAFRYGDQAELAADTPAGLEAAMKTHWDKGWHTPTAPGDAA